MKVSIGISFFNPGILFKAAIYSILNQSFQDFELILLDDGSTDDSLAIAKSVLDSRVRVYSDGRNKGLPTRLNELIDLSKGKYIARMDADDMMHYYRILKQVDLLDKKAHIDFVCTGICSITANNQVRGARSLEPEVNLDPIAILTGQSGICHPTVMARKEWFKRNRYNESNVRAEDAELWLSASLKNDFNVLKIGEPLHYYREESSISYENLKKSYRTQALMLEKYSAIFSNKSNVERAILKIKVKQVIVKLLSALGLLKLLIMNKGNKTGRQYENQLQKELDLVLKKRTENIQ